MMKDIPVVAMTGYAMQGDDEQTGGAGFVSYLTKPIDTRSFLENIDRVLS
jgi:CheY-like chemotaxis protein